MHLLLQVHDELVYEVRESKIKECTGVIKRIMETALPEKERRGVPIIAEGKIGKNWGEMDTI